MINRNLSRGALKAGVASFIFMSGLALPAFAQDATPAASAAQPADTAQAAATPGVTTAQTGTAEAEIASDTIVVTGSLIRNPNLLASAPVTVVGAEEIDLRQKNTAEELLRDIPGVVPNIGSSVNNGNGGASFVDLRGLGSFRNIVLLNSARIVPSSFVGRVDLNNIPTALIERVDVLTGGASTTYGADAVSGVVNFITKRDFAGAELSVTEALNERGDGNTLRADLTIGGNFDGGKGNATLSVGYQQTDPVYQGDRDFSLNNINSQSGNPGGSGTTVPTRFLLGSGASRQINPTTGALQSGFTAFNFNPYNIFLTPFERYNIYGQARYEVSEHLEVYSEALFSKNRVSTIIAPGGAFSFTPLQIPVSNPYLPVAARNTFCASNDFDPNTAGIQTLTQAQCNAAALATSRSDPNYREFSTSVSRRSIEAGVRQSEYTTQLFNLKAGIRGSITDTISYDLYGSYGESENIQRQTGNFLLSRLQQSVRATNTATCLDATGGCVPINLFGPAGSITADQSAFVSAPVSSSNFSTLSAVHAVVNGDVPFTSPFATNAIGFAVGGEYREYVAGTSSDVPSQTPGEVLGNGAASPDVRGSYSVYEVFAEINAPIIEDKPFFKSLSINLGGRYSDYSTTNISYTYKAGGIWEPVDGFKVRGNYSRATRSPNISELFAPVVTGLDNLSNDPCAGAAPVNNANLRAICIAQGAPAASIGNITADPAGQVNVTGGGNVNLDVERSRSWTVGFVATPTQYLPGFALTVDWYRIHVEDAITSPTVQDVIDSCFDAGANPGLAVTPVCTSIRRDTATGALFGNSATVPGIPQSPSNLGTLNTSGIDLTANYRRDVGFGVANFSFNGNWTNTSRFRATPASVDRECVGYYSSSCASIQPKFTWNLRSSLTVGPVDYSILWRHIDGVQYEPLQLEDDLANNVAPLARFRAIRARNYLDLNIRAEIVEQLTLSLLVQNLLDTKPPLVGSTVGATAYNSGNTYPSTYDALGRRYSVTAKFRF